MHVRKVNLTVYVNKIGIAKKTGVDKTEKWKWLLGKVPFVMPKG